MFLRSVRRGSISSQTTRPLHRLGAFTDPPQSGQGGAPSFSLTQRRMVWRWMTGPVREVNRYCGISGSVAPPAGLPHRLQLIRKTPIIPPVDKNKELLISHRRGIQIVYRTFLYARHNKPSVTEV